DFHVTGVQTCALPISSGMTLTFGLMNVLNLAHGAFISLGAYAGATVLLFWMNDQASASSIWLNLASVVPALLFALLVASVIGWRSEERRVGQTMSPAL